MASEYYSTYIKTLRTDHESNAEWRIRERFLSANWTKIEETRLVCLSHCYVNVRQMGCYYPPPVMKQLQELSRDLGEDDISDITNLPSRIKGVETLKFVKSSQQAASSGPSTYTPSSHNHGQPIQMTHYAPSTSNAALSTANYGPSQPKIKKIVPIGMNFVKASSEYKSTDVATHEEQLLQKQNLSASLGIIPVQGNKTKGMGLGFTTNKYSTSGVYDLDTRFRTLSTAVKDVKKKFGSSKNSIEVLQMSVDKAKMSMECNFKDLVGSQHAHTFVCTITIDFVAVGEGKGTNKKTAKHAAFDSAISKLSSGNLSVDQSNSENPVLVAMATNNISKTTSAVTMNTSAVSSTDSTLPTSFQNTMSNSTRFVAYSEYVAPAPVSNPVLDNTCLYESNFKSISIGTKRKTNSLNGDISMFIIFENDNVETSNATAVLRQSCDINKALLEFHYGPEPDGIHMHCQVDIEGQYIADVSAVGKVNSKTLASMRAIEELKKVCWTIRVKQSADCQDADTLSRDSVMGEIQKQMQNIPNDNIGNKLLRKMGWSGGGVGAEGNIGKAEPVACGMEQIVNREGLGLHTADGMKNFRSNIKEIVENYAKSTSQEDLAFTSDFTKEERAFIHSFSQRLGLKSLSRGKGEDRHLTLSRKRTTDQLFDHLIREGGSTHKYDLIPPGSAD